MEMCVFYRTALRALLSGDRKAFDPCHSETQIPSRTPLSVPSSMRPYLLYFPALLYLFLQLLLSACLQLTYSTVTNYCLPTP